MEEEDCFDALWVFIEFHFSETLLKLSNFFRCAFSRERLILPHLWLRFGKLFYFSNLFRLFETGYRSILDAMKSFAINAQPIDIEDLSELTCLSNGSCADQPSKHTAEAIVLDIGSDKQKWIMPSNMNEFYSL